ncbi:MAG: glycosyltransferase family 4 protein [Nitrospira sp.]|nr:glycosyltransferase family 4 protein [bacterium]MBL7047982.1 glycosyltransferase family 4 protein [Nitrospira sp.]
MNSSEGLKVLFLSPGYKPYLGGTERIVEQLAHQYLKMEGISRVGVLTTRMDFNHMPPRENLELPSEEEIDGLSVYRVSFYPKKLKYFYTLPIGLISLEAVKVIRKFKPDIIHYLLTEWFCANAWLYLLSSKKCSHIYTVAFHELPPSRRYLLMQYVNIFLGRVVDKVQVHSDHIRQRVMEHYRVPAKKIEVIPMGAISDEKKSPNKEVAVGEKVSFVAVGRLSADKGQLDLLECFQQALSRSQREMELVLVGGDGGHRELIETYINENGLQDNVRITGYVSEDALHEYYRKSDVFILLTRMESFGIVFAEAQSFGLPIIAYRIGPLESAFKKGALLAEPYDQKIVADSILRLAEDDGFRSEMSIQAYTYAWENFSWQRTAASFLQLYRDAVREKQS